MVRATTPKDLQGDLTLELLAGSNPEDRCPNFRTDSIGPYCGRDLIQGEKITDERRGVCDNISLQLWCLDKDRYNICIWYQGEPFRRKVGVTSENKLKVSAVRYAYDSWNLAAEVVGYASFSGVGEQPINEQVLLGARNRISDLRQKVSDLDRVVSIESGIFEENEGWVDKAVVVLLDTRSGKEYVAYSEGVVFPKEYVERAREIGFDKMTVGKVMADAGYVTDAKDPHKSISGKSRTQYIVETLLNLVIESEKSAK